MLKSIAKDLPSVPDLEGLRYPPVAIGTVEVAHSDFGEGVSFVIATYCFVYRC